MTSDNSDHHAHEISVLQQRLDDKVDEIHGLRSFVERLSNELMGMDMKVRCLAGVFARTRRKNQSTIIAYSSINMISSAAQSIIPSLAVL
jgi:hypothetical protein